MRFVYVTSVTVTSAVPVHPSAVVPVTVYVVLIVGLTVYVAQAPKEQLLLKDDTDI